MESIHFELSASSFKSFGVSNLIQMTFESRSLTNFFISSEGMITALTNLSTTINRGSDADVYSYIFLARTVNFLAGQNRTANELTKNVWMLEQKIGYADDVPRYIYKYAMREKQLYYIYYSIVEIQE